jgi:uncharacterized cupredoxin-like copper-binding protein
MKAKKLWFVLVGVIVTAVSIPVFAIANASSVNVLLLEWKLRTDVAEIAPGKVTFVVQNRGHEPHEFVLLRTDEPHNALPTKAEGGINEDAAGEVVDEIEDIQPGTTRKMTVSLEPGRYTLLCNMVEMEDDEREEHYVMGMNAPLIVK